MPEQVKRPKPWMMMMMMKTFIRHISRSKKNSATYYHKCSQVFIQNTRYSFQILLQLKLYRQFSKNIQISNFMKIRPVEAELSHAGKQTDRQT
jgi:hypothetical protein